MNIRVTDGAKTILRCVYEKIYRLARCTCFLYRLPLFFALWLGYKFTKKTKVISLDKCELSQQKTCQFILSRHKYEKYLKNKASNILYMTNMLEAFVLLEVLPNGYKCCK